MQYLYFIRAHFRDSDIPAKYFEFLFWRMRLTTCYLTSGQTLDLFRIWNRICFNLWRDFGDLKIFLDPAVIKAFKQNLDGIRCILIISSLCLMSDLIVSIGQTKAMFSLDWLSRSSFLLFAPQVRLTPVKAVTFDFRVYFLMMMVLCWASCCCKVGLVRIWTLEYRQMQSSDQYSSVYFIISSITLDWPSVLYSAVHWSVVKLRDESSSLYYI